MGEGSGAVVMESVAWVWSLHTSAQQCGHEKEAATCFNLLSQDSLLLCWHLLRAVPREGPALPLGPFSR